MVNGIDLSGGFYSIKRIGKTKYKYVYKMLIVDKKQECYEASIPKLKWRKLFHEEREAAKQVDLMLISKNLTPVNIYKKTP